MFGLFDARCPVDLDIKVWCERRFRDLVRLLGLSNLANVEVLVPDHPQLPQSFEGSGADILDLFDFVCERMNVEPHTIDLSLFPAQSIPDRHAAYIPPTLPQRDATGEVELASIHVADHLPERPSRLLAVLARSVAMEVIRTRCPTLWESNDLHACAEVVPLLFGFGVFLANETVEETNYSDALTVEWRVTRNGFLTAQTHGYLNALFAWVRFEPFPQWAKALRLDARETMKIAEHFLIRHADTIFDRDLIEVSDHETHWQQVEHQLSSDSQSQRLNALIELQESTGSIERYEEEIRALVNNRDYRLRATAIDTLSLIVRTQADTFDAITQRASDRNVLVRREVARYLRPGMSSDSNVMGVLGVMLNDVLLSVATQAALSLAEFSDLARPIQPSAIRLLKRALTAQDDAAVRASIQLLDAMGADWDAIVADLPDMSWQVDVQARIQELTDGLPLFEVTEIRSQDFSQKWNM